MLIIAVGDSGVIERTIRENSIDAAGITVKHAPGVFNMEDNPLSMRRRDNDTSMAVGLNLLAAGEGDAFVSAGSTGALVMGGIFLVKRLAGVKKPAIGSVMPGDNGPFMLVDSGADIDCTPKSLHTFAVMGDVYMSSVMGVERPRIALANIGVEKTKGTKLYVQAYELLSADSGLNFTGNAEIRDIPFTAADVIVADGFTGNVILKMYEGTAKAILNNIKAIFKSGITTKISYLGVKSGFDAFKTKMDYKEYGGAPILGLKLPVIKAHGSSDARTFKNAVRQARDFAQSGVTQKLAARLDGEDVQQDDV